MLARQEDKRHDSAAEHLDADRDLIVGLIDSLAKMAERERLREQERNHSRMAVARAARLQRIMSGGRSPAAAPVTREKERRGWCAEKSRSRWSGVASRDAGSRSGEGREAAGREESRGASETSDRRVTRRGTGTRGATPRQTDQRSIARRESLASPSHTAPVADAVADALDAGHTLSAGTSRRRAT